MSTPKNINQVFIANPITTNAATDLMYFGQSPYGATDDAAMTYADFSAQFISSPGTVDNAVFITSATGVPEYLANSVTPGYVLTANASAPPSWQAVSSPAVPIVEVVAATTANLAATYANGTAGVGATLSATATGAVIFDTTINNVAGSRYLFKNQTTTYQNGVYVCTLIGRFGQAAIFTRDPDYDTPAEINNTGLILVQQGNTLAGTVWYNSTPVVTIGSDAITYSKFTGINLPLTLAQGGTGAALTASNGGILYSNATTSAILAGTATARQILMSGASTTPIWSTATYPATTTINQIIYSSANNVISGLATGNNSILATGATGIPALTTTLPAAVQVGVDSLNSGTAASNTTFWRGDGTWASAGGGSSPFTVGTGPDSAKGGDGSTLAGGDYAIAYGSSTTSASGNDSVAFGSGCLASGNYSVAMGQGCTASGSNSFAVGFNCQASDAYTFAFGNGAACTVGASYAVAIGNGAQATAIYSYALGNFATASGTGSYAIGNNASAYGAYSYAFGSGSTADPDYAWAVGLNVSVYNSGSYVWGDNTGTPNTSSGVNQWVQTFAGGYYWYLNGTPTLAAKIDTLGNFTNALGTADISKTILTPSTGDTITLVTTNTRTILNPAGTIAALTINMPASPVDGQIQMVASTQIVTTLTVSGNGNSIIGNPVTLAVGQSFSMIYDVGTTTWYPA